MKSMKRKRICQTRSRSFSALLLLSALLFSACDTKQKPEPVEPPTEEPKSYQLQKQYAQLGQPTKIKLPWVPQKPVVILGKTKLDVTNGATNGVKSDTKNTNTVQFVLPKDHPIGLSELSIIDVSAQAQGTGKLNVLGQLSRDQRDGQDKRGRHFSFLVKPDTTEAQLETLLKALAVDYKKIPLEGEGACAGALIQGQYSGQLSYTELLNELDRRAAQEPDLGLISNPVNVWFTDSADANHNVNHDANRTVTATQTATQFDSINARTITSVARVHSRGFRGKGTTIAILDTGVGGQSQASTAAWGERLLAGRQFTAAGASGQTTDDYVGAVVDENGKDTGQQVSGHGSQVASLAAGARFGIAPEANVLPVKVCDKTGYCRTGDVIRGICWALGQKKQFGGDLKSLILNLSIGGDTGHFEQDALQVVLKSAIDQGVTVVASAGNQWGRYLANPALGQPSSYPAALDLDGLIAVGSVRQPTISVTGRPLLGLSQFSNRGQWVDILAAGSLVRAVDAQGQERNNTGTSFAAPQVAGAAALWRQRLPNNTPSQIQAKLQATASTGQVILDSVDQGLVTDKLLNFADGNWANAEMIMDVSSASSSVSNRSGD